MAKIASFIFLFLGFFLLFCKIRWLESVKRLLRRTQAGLEDAARQRGLANRQKLLQMQTEHSFLIFLEQELNYSGLRIRFPFLSLEMWITGNAVLTAVIFLGACFAANSVMPAAGVLLIFYFAEYLAILLCRAKTMRSVNDNLLKFLDFLGNYSITAGELTGIFHQISKYMEEPLRSVLEEFYYEAGLTGDINLALLSMAEKVEHPKFKEMARNLEISIRYCADFTAFVNSTRKNVREYLRSVEERKGMLREGMVNMMLLFGLSVFVLITVDKLIGVSVWEILTGTIPGKIALGTLGVIFLQLFGKMKKLQN